MPSSEPVLPLDSFVTFGDLLKYLRRRAHLTQREVAIAVGYSEAQISRLEQNQRPPDLAALTALFIPALYVDDEPEIVARLMELASQARGEKLPHSGVISFSRSVRREVLEDVRRVEENILNNLPLQLTSFVGREREMAEIKSLLGKARLVTLTGSGGCGKTRLALETAGKLVDSYKDGIWLIELASISDPNLVLQAVASTLGLPESRDANPTSALTKYLRPRQTLLILDNCEQVIAGAANLVQEILQTCPKASIITTSRENLNLPGEVLFRVPSLSMDGRESSRSEAVSLFIDRAQTVLPSFPLTEEILPEVTQICKLVDGMPLGIELAAAKIAVLSVEQIATRLHDSFQMLGQSRSSHRQTLEATIQWSYDLLSEEERVLLQRLSVFAGGWTLSAAEAVTSDETFISEEKVLDLLSQLVNKSLVVVDLQTQTEARYGLLRIVRQYGYDRLMEHEEWGAIQNRHIDFFLKLVEQAGAGLMTAQSPYWLKQLDAEQDNLRAAFAYGQSTKRYEATLELAGELFWFWQTRGHISEGRAQLEKLLTISPDSNIKASARAKGLWAAGTLAWIQGDYAIARAQVEESLSLFRQYDPANKFWLAISLRELGIISTYQGEFEYAHSVLDESISLLQEIGDKWNLALAFYNHGLVHEAENDIAAGRENFQASLSLFRELNEPWGLSVAVNGFGRIAGRQADYATARSHLEESLELSQKLDDPWSNASTLYLLGEVARLQNDRERAKELFVESLTLNQVVGDKAMIGFTLHNLGKIAESLGKFERAIRLFGAAQALREDPTNTTSWSLTDQAQCEQDIATLRNTPGNETFEAAWIKGQAMSVDEAIAFALNEDKG